MALFLKVDLMVVVLLMDQAVQSQDVVAEELLIFVLVLIHSMQE